MKHVSDEFSYHENKRSPYFEGWYYKVTTDDVSFAVIVGIAKNKTEEHAFIQTIDTVSRKTQYQRFSMIDVIMHKEPFQLQIQDNIFTMHKLIVNMDNIKLNMIQYGLTPLHCTNYAPTIMGPFSYLPHMQCIHSIISLHHYVRGTIEIASVSYQVKGIGYMEKDRGVSFPTSYIWTQSNHCKIKHSCFFLSIADIPLGFFNFTGCICVLCINGKQYRFTTYDGVRIHKLDIERFPQHNEVKILLRQKGYQLYIKIHCGHAYPLIAPQGAVMETKILESLDSVIHLKVYHHHTLLHDISFDQAGCEIHMS